MQSGENSDRDENDSVFRRAREAFLPGIIWRHYPLKFFVAFLVVIVGVALVGGLNFVLIQETVKNEAASEFRSQASSRAHLQSQWVSEMRSQTQLISGTAEPFSLSLRDARRHSSTDVVALHYVNASNGEVVASTDRSMSGRDLDIVTAPWVRNLNEMTLLRAPVSRVWTTNVSYEREGQRVVAFTSPTPDGQSAVVLVASADRLVEQFESSRTLNTAIYTPAGRFLFGDSTTVSNPQASTLDRAHASDRSQLLRRDDALVVYAPVNQTNWVAVTSAPKSELYQTSSAVGNNVISVIVTSVVLMIVVGAVLGRHTVVPLNRLRRRTRQLADNNFDVDLTTERNDEIGQLYADFEAMRDALRDQIRETRQAKEEIEAQRDNLQRLTTRLQLAMEETNTGVWEWDLVTGKHTWDEASERLFGYEPGEFPGTLEAFAEHVPDEDMAMIREAASTAIETGEEYRVDFRVDPLDGDHRWIQARGVVRYGENGTPEQLLGIQTDITERKERERKLEETKQDLEQSNEKLEQFASLVSHDLRNPLTVIFGRVEYMQNGDVDDVGKHVDAIERSANRMRDIIDDLLALSRVGQEIDELQTVSLAGVVEDSWDNVQLDDTELESSVPQGTRVTADRDRLLHVFENLFRNAAEHNEPPLTVRVGVLDAPGETDLGGDIEGFYVEDDGEGIPADERGDIFDHGYTTDPDGTGFGLSIVDEIVSAHGWSVSISEGDGGGARFEIRTTEQVVDQPPTK